MAEGTGMGRKKAIAAILLAVALAAGWWFGSPYWTLSQIRAAAKSNDADAISAYVDYPALRQDVKEKLTERMVGLTSGNDATSKLGRAMGMALVTPMVDTFVSPAGLKTAFERIGTGGAAKAGAAVRGQGGKEKQPKVERLGFNSFRVGDPDQPGSGLVFERRGLGWKLAGIDLPPEPPTRR